MSLNFLSLEGYKINMALKDVNVVKTLPTDFNLL